MADGFLSRMGIDWGPAISGTRQFISQLQAEFSKLDRLGPTARARALSSGQAAVTDHIQGLVGTGGEQRAYAALGGEPFSARDAARLTAQAAAQFEQYQAASNQASIESTVQMRREVQQRNLAAARQLEGDAQYQAAQAELAAAAKRRASVANKAAVAELEGDEAYIRERAETLAAQRRINAQVRAQAGAINGGGGAGGGGGILGGLSGIGSTIVQGAAIGAGFKLAQEVRDAVSEALALNQQLALLQDQADAIGQNGGFTLLRDQISQSATETGVAASTVAALAGEFLGLYQNAGQAAIATADASRIIRVIGGDATTSGPAIAALAEDLGVSVREIGNTIIDLRDKTGRAGTDLVVALGQVAPVAAELNLTLDQTRALIEAVAVGSAKTGQQIGEGLARVLPELQKNLPKLDQLGINISPAAAQGDTVQALRDLISQYGQLDSAQQKLVVEQLGGPRNAQILAAALRDPARALAELNSQLVDNGQLNSRASAAEDTLKGSTEQFHQSLVKLGDSFARSGAIQDLTDFIKLLTHLAEVIGNVNSGLGGLPARVAEGFALYRVAGLVGGGAAGAAAGGGGGLGGILGSVGLGGLLGRGASSGLGQIGSDGLLTGAEVTGGGTVAAIGTVAAPVIAAGLAAVQVYQKFQASKAAEQKYRDDLAKNYGHSFTDPQLQDIVSGRQKVYSLDKYDNPVEDKGAKAAARNALTSHAANALQSDVTTLLGANVFSDDDIKKIQDDLAHSTDRKKVDDLAARVRAASATPAGAKALRDTAQEKARRAAVVAVSGDENISTLQEAVQAYQAGSISYDDMVRIGRAEVTGLEKFRGQQDSDKKRLAELATLAKLAGDHIKQATQDKIDQLTAIGGLSDAASVAIYNQQVKDLAAAGADPQSQLQARTSAAGAQHKLFTDTISADQALRIAGAGRDPLASAGAASQNAGDNLDILRQQGYGTNSPEYKDALAKKLQADQAVVSAQNDITRAQLELLKANDAADPVQVARDNQRLAAEAVAQAVGDAAQLSAQAQKVQADRDVNDAIAKVGDARLELLKAMRTAAGDTVGAAQVAIDEANKHITEAKAQGVGDNSAQMIDLQRALVDAQAGQVSARIQQIETATDQDLQLRTITVREAVDRLRSAEALATSDQERKGIEIKIRQLLTQTGQNLATNIPQGVTVPTLYEARRFAATSGGGLGYNDNRTISAHFYVDGTDVTTLKGVVADVLGVANGVLGVSSRSY